MLRVLVIDRNIRETKEFMPVEELSSMDRKIRRGKYSECSLDPDVRVFNLKYYYFTPMSIPTLKLNRQYEN